MAIRGLDSLRKKLKRLSKAGEPPPPEMSRVAFRVQDAIKRRTVAGIDSNGRRFKAYSPAYGRWKKRRGGGWLDDKGHMLSAMTHRASAGRAEIFFRAKVSRGSIDENRKALVHNEGLGDMKKRHFFGLHKDDEKKIVSRVRQRIRREIRA